VNKEEMLMTIALSLKEFWQDLTVKPTATANPAEKIIQFPQQLGQGYNYHISLRPELSLTIRQYQLRDRIFDSVPEAIASLLIITLVNTPLNSALNGLAKSKMNMAFCNSAQTNNGKLKFPR
jgi:hypothetical protein